MRLSIRRGASAMKAVCALSAAALTLGAAHADERIGWVWANKPRAAKTYVPDAAHSFNSKGGKILIERNGDKHSYTRGYYLVYFRKLYAPNSAMPNNAVVTAVNTTGFCEIAGWNTQGPFNSIMAQVQCYDRHGQPADSEFTLLYQARSGTFGDASTGAAFVYGEQPNNADYAPTAGVNYNSTGTLNTITHAIISNDYYVHIPGLSAEGGNVQVSSLAVGSTGKRCSLASDGWWSTGTGTDIHVKCYDNAGSPVAQWFTVAYTVGRPFSRGASADTGGAYAWANQPNMGTPYTPPTPWNFNSVSSSDLTTAYEASKGNYVLDKPASVNKLPSMMLATARGSESGGRYCNVFSFDGPAEVRCFRTNGVLAPSGFAVTMESLN